MKLAAIPAGINFPAAALAIQINAPADRSPASGPAAKPCTALPDLTYDDITAAQLANAIRGHWIRDVTFTEDPSQIRTGRSRQVSATLRNLAVNLHRLRGATNIAAACRRISRHPDRVLSLVR